MSRSVLLEFKGRNLADVICGQPLMMHTVQCSEQWRGLARVVGERGFPRLTSCEAGTRSRTFHQDSPPRTPQKNCSSSSHSIQTDDQLVFRIYEKERKHYIVVLHLIVCENHLSMTPIVTMFVIYFKVFGVNSAFAGSNVSAVMMLTSGRRRMLMRSCPHLYLPAFPGSARGRCYYKPSHLPPSPLIQAFALHSVCELH